MAKTRKADLQALADTWAGVAPTDDTATTPTPGAEAVEAPTPDQAPANTPKRKATRKATPGKAPAVGDAESGRLVQVAAYVTPAEAEAFAALARAEDRPVSYVLRRLIRQALGLV